MAACLGQPHPVKNRFNLGHPEPPEMAANAAGRRTLILGAVTAAPPYDGQALVYRLGPNRYDSDFYNEFMAPPTRLLAEVISNRLTRTSQRLRVTAVPGLAVADYGLEIHILNLYGDFYLSPPKAIMTLRFTLSDLRPTKARVILDRLYPCERPLPEKGGPADLIAAFDLCLAATLEELAREMDQAL